MSQTTLEDLVNEGRFPDDNLLGVILYFPVGALLVIIRLLVGILVWLISAILPEISSIRIFVTNFTCFTLGVCVRNEGQRDDKTRLMVSNSVSIFDPLALHVSTLCITPSTRELPPPLAWALGVRQLGSLSTNQQFCEAVKKKFSDIPRVAISAQPEGCPTSGKALLKFSEWPFMLYDRVQPVAIDVRRWFGKVTVSCPSHWSSDAFAWGDLFWFLWSPYTVYTLHLLPTVERADKETTQNFASRVQLAIADYLKVEATQFTSGEVRALVRGRAAGAAAGAGPAGAAGGAGGADALRMAAQVKEVLPHVPLAVIIKDLGRTRSVDVTLSNILEGAVAYEPERAVGAGSSGGPPVGEPRQAQGRQLSFQERKLQLIQECRRKYCEKRGLTHLL